MEGYRTWLRSCEERNYMAHRIRVQGQHLERPLVTEDAIFQDYDEERASRLRWVCQLMKYGAREWDEHRLLVCLYSHDVDEVLKVRPMQH
jgi:hypothetical protein